MFRRPLNVCRPSWPQRHLCGGRGGHRVLRFTGWRRQDKADRLLEARDLGRLPWDILLLFGGGRAAGVEAAGWAGLRQSGNRGWSAGAMLILVTAIGLFATELVSNLALTLP